VFCAPFDAAADIIAEVVVYRVADKFLPVRQKQHPSAALDDFACKIGCDFGFPQPYRQRSDCSMSGVVEHCLHTFVLVRARSKVSLCRANHHQGRPPEAQDPGDPYS